MIGESDLKLLEYLLGNPLAGEPPYPIEEDRDYIELGDIFREEE